MAVQQKGPWIPCKYVVPLLDKGVVEYETEVRWGKAIGVDPRKFWGIRHEFEYVGFDTVDKILVSLNMEYLWHFPSSEGGFEDLIVMKRKMKKAPPESQVERSQRTCAADGA